MGTTRSPGMMGFYVYGIADGAFDVPDGVVSIDGRESAVQGIAVEAAEGTKGGALTAIVSRTPRDTFEPTRRQLLAHTKVLEAAMAAHTVLPLRYGTVARNRMALTRLLLNNAHAFREALHKLKGRIEINLKANWSGAGPFEALLAENPALANRRTQLAKRSAQETYYERIELGQQIEAALAEKRARDTETILRDLVQYAVEDTPQQITGEKMILNHAFLVDRRDEAAFERAVEAVDAKFGGALDFRYVAPLPPYSFCTLEVQETVDDEVVPEILSSS